MELPIAVVFMPFPRFVVPTSDPPPIAAPKTGGAVLKVFDMVRELANVGNAIALQFDWCSGTPIARRVGCRTFGRSTSH